MVSLLQAGRLVHHLYNKTLRLALLIGFPSSIPNLFEKLPAATFRTTTSSGIILLF